MLIFFFLGFAVLVIVGFFIVAARAPYGWEDEDGFHYGEKPQ